MTKKCYKCKQTKSLDRFYKKSSNKTDMLSGRCKKCDDILKATWRKNNSKKVKAYERKRWKSGNKREKDILRGRKHRLEMSDLYIRDLIRKNSETLTKKDIPKDLIELYRIVLTLKRELKLTPKLGRWRTEPQ
tara:strand:+ start:72 stop:470 length:399 start_codon:yes stop_codon:yes gene_type:complete